jgi:hypothetical protein
MIMTDEEIRNAITSTFKALPDRVQREIERRDKIMEAWPEIHSCLVDSAHRKHEIIQSLTGWRCSTGCTSCRAARLLENLPGVRGDGI